MINAYPEFMELYKDISEFHIKPKELIHMYSKALTAEKELILSEIDSALKAKESENESLRKQLEELKAQLNNSK